MRRTLVLFAALALMASLAGCTPHPAPTPTPTPKGSAMDATQAHDEVDALLVASEQAIGGSWRSIDGGAEICTAVGGVAGAVFPFGRIGPGVPTDQQSAVIATVAAAWKAAGFAAVEAPPRTENGHAVRELRYPENGYGQDGLYLTLSMTTLGSDLDAQSRCIPGDADKINEDRQTQG